MARIYTRTGDRGETSLGDGTRARKSGLRVDLYGEVDELISTVGYCATLTGPVPDGANDGYGSFACDLKRELIGIQNRLFTLASVLADPRQTGAASLDESARRKLKPLHLETLIDSLDAELPALKNFILPGGSPLAAALHVARAVCRRVERKAVALAAVESLPESGLVYLNRLSDFLFTAARAANHAAGCPDELWNQDEGAAD